MFNVLLKKCILQHGWAAERSALQENTVHFQELRTTFVFVSSDMVYSHDFFHGPAKVGDSVTVLVSTANHALDQSYMLPSVDSIILPQQLSVTLEKNIAAAAAN